MDDEGRIPFSRLLKELKIPEVHYDIDSKCLTNCSQQENCEMIRGAYKLVDVCKKKISENESEISKNGKSSWMEVECLGACVNSPMVQINDDYFEDLDEEKFSKIIDQIDKNQKPKPGSYRGRLSSEPENIRKTLLSNKNA